MITHEFLSALKDHFISKDKCHDRDGILQFQNQVNYIFLKWKEDIFLFHYKNKKVVKVDFKEFLQGGPYSNVLTVLPVKHWLLMLYKRHTFIWATLFFLFPFSKKISTQFFKRMSNPSIK